MKSRILSVASLAIFFVAAGTANADPWHHHRGHYGPRIGFGVVVPPPVVVAPYGYPPVYGPPVVPVPPPVPIVVPQPVFVPPPPAPYVPMYSYGIMGGPRGVGFGYSSPGFGVYVGR